MCQFAIVFLGLLIAGTTTAPAAKEGNVIFRDDFSGGMDNWLVEKWEDKGIDVKAEKGRLHVTTQSKEHGVMLWLRKDLPKDFAIEYDFTPLSKTGFFLIFFCATGSGGEDVLGEKMQADRPRPTKTLFDKYVHGKVNCYHISYRRGEEANCNLRKNPGLVLLKQQVLHELLPQDKTVHVKLTRRAARITLEVDGKPFMDYEDKDHPWEGGHLALRQVYDSDATYANVVLTELR